ncbi:hypothetical protein [Cupriavidus taiwanensis]|uniref:hypothetical protein n=1 Tax=Cupriavidus taiwanensis TaxID=164546 RepID=UPI0011C0340E|nr:hypothetical protein [Cupriavidus taiwanensis]
MARFCFSFERCRADLFPALPFAIHPIFNHLAEVGAGAGQGHSHGLVPHFHWPFCRLTRLPGMAMAGAFFVFWLALQG